MKIAAVTTITHTSQLREEGTPVLAIDLGFAAKARSCGLSDNKGHASFKEAIERTVTWMTGKKEGVLILEAPLSHRFIGGNPASRGDFESKHQNGHKSPRLWYTGPGATTSLAAQHFLTELRDQTNELDTIIHLVEGFASRYDTSKEKTKPSHQQVATRLVHAWNEQWQLAGAPEPIELHAKDGISPNHPDLSEAPIVLRLPDGMTK